MKVFAGKPYFQLILLSCILLLASYKPCFGQAGLPEALYTRAERTNYEETSLHKDVMDFVTALDRNSNIAKLEIFGTSLNGRDLPLVIMSDPPVNSPVEAKNSGKTIIYIQGNIHAGEVEGKEASMELMRKIAFGPKRFLLENQIILFGPIYNSDGNDALGENRRSQEGSPKLTGTRSSGEGYDLNRDGLRIEAIETKAMIKNIINKWDPVIFVDLHTTNGSRHGYSLTYAPGMHTAGHPATMDYLVDIVFPEVAKKVKERSGLDMYLYGGFGRREWPPTSFSAAPHMPRFLTNSMALKNKLSILVETFSHDRFEKRILSNKMFLVSLLEYTNEHKDEIRSIVTKSAEETVQQVKTEAGTLRKGVRFRTAQIGEPADLLIYEAETYTDDNGSQRRRYTGRREWISGVRMMQKYEPVKTATVPRGYVFPAELSNVADKLKEHSVSVKTLDKSTKFDGEEFAISSYSKNPREYQKHNLVTIEGEFRKTTKEMPAGSFIVDLAQSYAYLIFYMLEPEADDGLVVWNYFDSMLDKDSSVFPVFKYYSMK